jgi:fumarate reductase subunit C
MTDWIEITSTKGNRAEMRVLWWKRSFLRALHRFRRRQGAGIFLSVWLTLVVAYRLAKDDL